jgi:sensor histidine kinase YesM
MVIVIIATANLGPQRGPKRIAALTAAVILSAGAGVTLRVAIQGWLDIGAGWDYVASMLSYLWPRYALLGGMLTIVGELYRREAASIEAMQRAEIDRATFEREMAEARLQVLQAQIEPHFLFNTLANVRRLYDKDSAAGGRMLENLMRYLEVALPRIRDSESTLGRDSELVDAFLRIQRIRMGSRLTFSIDIPAALLAHSVPPMMLLTLAENAIKHGLNPSPDGGLIRVMARTDADRLLLSVADTGVGFGPGSGAGTGLANIRARLAAQFGDHASLALENNDLGGATATITLPLAGAATAR